LVWFGLVWFGLYNIELKVYRSKEIIFILIFQEEFEEIFRQKN
jgi:hypothetical protein